MSTKLHQQHAKVALYWYSDPEMGTDNNYEVFGVISEGP